MTVDTSEGHPAMDYREHLRTYDGFVRGAIVMVAICALTLFGMLIFLV
ncbi:MAG: aa3-type cytochrome c oxidase subunit IV [Hyphomicrobiaceae bacterium]|jgi:hypothetical protein